MNRTLNKYHTVAIRCDLPRIEQDYQDESIEIQPPNDFWMKVFQRMNGEIENYQIQYNSTNGPYTTTCVHHPILTAFLRAYNSHEDIVLCPDDIWLMVSIYFSKYVNQKQTDSRYFYIDNEKDKILTIEHEEIDHIDWEDFLEQIRCQITSHIKPDICNLLTMNFSTTTKIESLLSSLTIMNTFQKTIQYFHSTNSCGIRNVHFMGNRNDWILLYDKVKQLRSWTIENDDFYEYINGILPILNEFIQTYDGNVNNHFWDTIFDLEHTKDESNQSNGINTNGWFIRLCYGNHRKQICSMSHLTLNSLIVPVIVENEQTNTLKTSYIIGGFHGILSEYQRHKPVMSLLIIDDMNSIRNFED